MAEKKKEETLERTYTVPLRKAFTNAPPYRKTNKAVSALREFLVKHMKAKDVRLGQHVNEALWQHGIKNPPPRITVHAVRDSEGMVRAELEGKSFKESVKAAPREERGGTLKDKLTSAIGGKKGAEDEEKPAKAEPKSEEKPAEKPKAAPKAKAEPKAEAVKAE